MKIKAYRRFKRTYSGLPPVIQKKVDKQLVLLSEDLSHPSLHTPKKLNVEKSMGMSFFTSCPLTGGLSVPLQTVAHGQSS